MASSPLPELIEPADCVKSFGTARAVQGVSLQVNAGEAYGLVGPDGAGKTTTLRMLVGALTPDSGTRAGGRLRPAAADRAGARPVGYLAQRFSLYGDLTVLENLRFFGQVRGVQGEPLRRRAEELLSFVGLGGFGGAGRTCSRAA